MDVWIGAIRKEGTGGKQVTEMWEQGILTGYCGPYVKFEYEVPRLLMGRAWITDFVGAGASH